MDDFNISICHDIDMFGVPWGYYSVESDGVELNIGFFKCKKIHDIVKKIYNSTKKKRMMIF
jgi:hypothetical protein